MTEFNASDSNEVGVEHGDISVVMACYTEERLASIEAGLSSLQRQKLKPRAVIVAVDNNDSLAECLSKRFDWITVILNRCNRGASSTRNCGVQAVTTKYTAFLDDDEMAEPDWLLELTRPFAQPDVVGTGGKNRAAWTTVRPSWFPDEFAWVVGGSYEGLPTVTAAVRNVWSGNMAVRTETFRSVGGFRTDFGKRGAVAEPEDTDLCIRMAAATGGRWMFVPTATVYHLVPGSYTSLRYFVSRCFAEGRGKAVMGKKLKSTWVAIESECDYAWTNVGAALQRLCSLRWAPSVQGLVMLLGLVSAVSGYLLARTGLHRRSDWEHGMSGRSTEGDGNTPADAAALVVGPGDRFLSGVSYYTALLTSALAERGPVATLLLRRLCPRAFYPGRARVGSTDGALPLPEVPVFDGLDWFWGSSALAAWRFWRRIRPRAVILQWWTGTTLHSYLALAWLAKRAGTRLVVEFHEVQDVGEARLPLARQYTRAGMRLLLRKTDAVVVHSEFDLLAVRESYPQLADLPVKVIPHGPYANHTPSRDADTSGWDGTKPRLRPPRPGEPVRLLIFGVVRPYKGHAELAAAARLLKMSGLDIHVSVVGEIWHGYREPLEELAALLPADRLSVVDRYVDDAEVPAFFAAAHLVVLPYRRCSASGPLHIAMSCGLPVVTTSVGGLVEAAAGYTGAVLVPPGDPAALAEGIRTAIPLVGRMHVDTHSWTRSAEQYEELLNRIGAGWGGDGWTQQDRVIESSAAEQAV